MLGVVKARKILGKRSENMTDEQVMRIENTLRQLANIIIDRVIGMSRKEQKELDNKIKMSKSHKS